MASAEVPADLKYTAEHEWVKLSGGVARVGITDFAQDALGSIVYVSVPEPGERVEAGEPCGEVESTKSVSDIYAPISGVVASRNEELEDAPELINSDAYGEGWLFSITPDDESVVETLLSSEEYQAVVDAAQ